jgi:PAS domain S-box-containing protein
LLPQAASRLQVPILRENQTLGVIIIESTSTRIFKEAATHVLTLLADHAATALENARLFREIQMEQERASLIIHAIADGLFTTDASGRIISFNPAAELLTGWKQSESLGKLFCEILGCHETGDSGQDGCRLIQAVHEQRILEEKIVIRQRMGTKRVLSLSMAPLPAMNDRSAGSVFLLRDITEQEEMNRLQRELIAAISHEIRAPLSHISTIAETLVSETETYALRPYWKYFENLTKQTQRMANFADRIQDVYQMETGRIRLQLRPLPASLLVEEVVRQWQATYPAYKFLLQTSEKPLWIWADESAFQNVLNNLLDNAVKYSPAGTSVTVTIRPDERGMISFMVEDQGPGIAAEHQTKIFQMF